MENYTIINASELNVVDFQTVKTSSPESARKSIDKSRAVLKFSGDLPPSLQNLTSQPRTYTFEEIKTIMDTDEWKTYDEIDDL